jgi:cytochrome c biogenesis protein CcdA
MEYLQALLDSTELPVVSAFILGLMTALSPCPLATNITAIGYIGREIENRRRVFISGVVYTAGRAFSYTALGAAIFFGAGAFDVARLFQGWGERLLGPLCIVIGLLMLDIIPLRFPSLSSLGDRAGERARSSYTGSFLLGVVFALAFCPYSGVLYFMILIPMTVASVEGLYLPAVFALATGIPVIIAAWLIAFTVGGIASFYDRLRLFERWFRRVVAVVFIGTGAYLLSIYFM